MIVIGDLMARYYANACDRIFGLIDPQKPTEPLTDQSGSVGIRPEFDERNQATREYCGDGVGHEQRVQQAAKVDLISPRELFEGLASGTPSAEYSAEQEAIRHAASTQNVFGQRATVIQQYHERLSRRNQLLHQQIVDSEVAPPADQWTPEELDQAKEYAEQCEPYEPQRIDLREEARKLRKEQLDRMPWHVPALNRKPEFVGDSSEFGAIAIDPKPLEELREELREEMKQFQLTKEQSHYLLNCIPDEYIKEYAEQYL